ncbi:MAG TPA: SPFH domain-containing protein [bacterium]|nr:SPFH domain-containing protein [bacterium]
MEKFVGSRQWTTFFVSLAGIYLVLILALAFSGATAFWAMLAPTIIVLVVSTWALFKGYRFFANNPKALDIRGQRYVSVPHNHVAIVLENGRYNGFLESGFYFVFPFFGLLTFSETIFLGTIEEEVFEDGNKIEFRGSVSEGISAPVKAVYNYKVIDPKKYAFEDGADDIVRGIISSLLRTTLGDLTVQDAREKGINMGHVRSEDPDLFDSIWSIYGLEILAINVSDIELSEEEQALNRQLYQAKIAKDVATSKAEEMEILARAEAKVLELRGEGLYKQVKSLADAKCTPDTILAYLAETKKWESMKDTDKTFIIDNGKSVTGMLAALKGVEGSGV